MPSTVPARPSPAAGTPPDAMIALEGLTKRFPGSTAPAVDGLDLAVPRGELVVFVGPSGCGKTTTLKMINRIIEPSAGRVVLDGTDATERPAHELRRDIGYVIQQIGLFPHRTIAQNVATVPRLLGWDKDRIAARTDELLSLMDLDPELAGRYPMALSGGQRQRVGVARALAADPPVLLMDEPYGAVDPLVRGRLQDQLLTLQRELGKTIVFVTHDIDEAIKLGDRIAILNVGGVLEQYATPAELLGAPANDFVRSFLGEERGLKRLSLLTTGDTDLERGPVVDATASAEQAFRVATAEGVDWVGVLDGSRLRGWLWTADLDPVRVVGDHDTHPFWVVIDRDTSLRGAVDAIVTTANQVAVVVDGEDYLGMLFLRDVVRQLAS
ncbi:ABC transporter ATP-binding protein [Egicoccus halophilus]|uniref:ABC-type quaternary amine transporter n=1 Tax=Egicoccus halophilus TaxID=1670830 RepID=A0A8J3A963_9ACTN|nr:ABC transporter ATP-binding protein [Egicoccus halophilus]GGI04847.1 putative ABC transporter, ATP-binding protein [Egicoccus halophilus]